MANLKVISAPTNQPTLTPRVQSAPTGGPSLAVNNAPPTSQISVPSSIQQSQKMSIDDFANMIKSKYPGSYDNVDNATLAQKIIEKYPIYADKVDMPQAPQQPHYNILQKAGRAVLGPLVHAGTRIAEAVASPFNPAAGETDMNVSLPGLGKFNVPAQNKTSFKQEVGNAVQVPAIALGPVAGGASYGLGDALQNNRSFVGTVAETVGGALAGKLLQLGGKYVLEPATGKIMSYVDGKVVPVAEQLIPQTVKDSASQIMGHLATASDKVNSVIENTKIMPKVVSDLGTKGVNLIEKGTAKVASPVMPKPKSVVDIVRAPLSTSEKAAAFAEGRGTPETLFKGPQIKPSAQDLAIARTAKGVGVNPDKSLVENISIANKGIASEATSLRAGLKASGKVFDLPSFNEKLSSIERPDLVASDQTLNNAYNKVIQRANDIVAGLKDDSLDALLNARTTFDQQIEKQYPNLYNPNAKESPLKSAITDIRQAWNDYIAERLGNDAKAQAMKASLQKQTNLYRAIDNMAENAVKTGSKIEQFSTKHPITSKVLKYGSVAAGGAIAGPELYGVGKKLIGK